VVNCSRTWTARAWKLFCCLLFVLFASSPVHAQGYHPTGFFFGLHFNTTQKVSGVVSFVVGEKSQGGEKVIIKGLLIEAEPGLCGVRGSLGYAQYVREGWLGLGFKGSYLRTWWNPWFAKGNQNYIGAGADITLFSMNLEGNLFYNLANSKRPVLLMLGFGLKI